MNSSRKNSRLHGFTIVEVMISVAIIIIVAVSTMNFQYNGAKPARQAEAKNTAAYLGELLLEDWKSTGGSSTYEPNTLGLGFTFVATGQYTITLDYQTFYVQLAQQLAPVSSGSNPDPVAGVTLQQLSITITWRMDYSPGVINNSDPTLTFTTFVRCDT